MPGVLTLYIIIIIIIIKNRAMETFFFFFEIYIKIFGSGMILTLDIFIKNGRKYQLVKL